MSGLDRIRVDCSPLTGRLRLARTNKAGDSALDVRECRDEILTAVVQHMTFGDGFGCGSEVTVTNRESGEAYTLTVRRAPSPPMKEEGGNE